MGAITVAPAFACSLKSQDGTEQVGDERDETGGGDVPSTIAMPGSSSPRCGPWHVSQSGKLPNPRSSNKWAVFAAAKTWHNLDDQYPPRKQQQPFAPR
jgi:hypothetical protein